MKDDCIFCQIISKKIPASFIYEDSDLVVFKDINPQAPIHWLVVPKKHIGDLFEADSVLFEKIVRTVKNLFQKEKLRALRLVVNVGDAAIVKHLHFHFLGRVKKTRSL